MIYPVTYSIQIIRRSAFDLTFTVNIQEDVPYDLTGRALVSQLWDRKREEKYGDFTVVVENAPLGILTLQLTPEQTLLLPTLGVYDVKVDNFYVLKGSFSVKEGYSDY